jgi:hypothetical protein
MALKIIGNIHGVYSPVIKDDIYMKNNEAAAVGQAFYLSSQRWTKSAANKPVEAICIKATAGGTNVFGVMELVKSGDILEVDYTGIPDAAFIPGLTAAVLDADGKNAASATVAGGHLLILEKDTTNTKVKMLARQNFTSTFEFDTTQ